MSKKTKEKQNPSAFQHFLFEGLRLKCERDALSSKFEDLKIDNDELKISGNNDLYMGNGPRITRTHTHTHKKKSSIFAPIAL